MNLQVQKPAGFALSSFLRRAEDVHKSGWFSNRGPQVRELESRLAELLGVKESSVVAVVNGTVGIQGFLSCSTVRFWSVPSYTFSATAQAALMSAKTISLRDIQDDWPETQISPGRWRNWGRIYVEPFGEPMLAPRVARNVFESNVFVDAAAGLGNAIANGTFPYQGFPTMYSLHATKAIGAGEGAILVLPDEGFADTVRSWINFGFSGSRTSVISGTNGKMSELMAAGINSVLDEWPAFRDAWSDLRLRVWKTEEQHGLNHFHPSESLSPYWIHEAKSSTHARLIREDLLNLGIETRFWWGGGLHSMPAFKSLTRKTWWRRYHTTSNLASRLVGLPYFLGIRPGQVETIGRVLSGHRGTSVQV